MTEKEYKESRHKGNIFTCGFCGNVVKDKPVYTLGVCNGYMGRDITDICENCLKKIEERVIE